MQPSTSSLGLTTIDSYLNSSEDCHFLLRALEKQAFENIVFAFRAQGPLTLYTELLLDHLKTALSIDDEEFNTKIRMVANNPYICRIAQQLNPSYDNDARWISFGYDSNGIEMAKIKQMNANNNAKLISDVSQHIRELHKHNRALPQANEALSLLTQLPKKPFVPERLRRFLRYTEMKFEERISNGQEEHFNIQLAAQQQKPTKNGVGRPRKRKKTEDAHSQREKRAKEEAPKKEQPLEKCPTVCQQNAKRMPIYEQRLTGTMENLAKSALSREEGNRSYRQQNLKSSPPSASSFSQPRQCQNKNETANFELPKDKHDALSEVLEFNCEEIKGSKGTQNERLDREDTSFVCARIRPFDRAAVQSNSAARAMEKNLKRSASSIGRTNDLQISKKYYSHFRLHSKFFDQTPTRTARSPCNFDDTNCHTGVASRLKRSCEERRNDKSYEITPESKEIGDIMTTNLSSFQMATTSFVAHSSCQNLTASNAVVEADHAYEKMSPSIPIVNDDTKVCVLPMINAPDTVRTENGMSNGICGKGTPTTSSSAFSIMMSNQLILDQPISTNEALETSGLDFLASTASLLAPMEPSAVKCNDKIAAASEG